MKNFITILNHRVHKGSIKRYAPREDIYLIIYFKASRSATVDSEAFKFDTKEERDEILMLLDSSL